MSCIRSKDTQPEMFVRRIVHGLGFRYRLHRRDLPGQPDMVFPSRRKIIFVNGCFWHYHRNCDVAGVPASNSRYWIGKLKATRERDKLNVAKLQRLGWQTEIIWECELGDPRALAKRISRFLKS
jgi:DNA mismatch endonuclease (patch repair protein)